jgi:hypothetical protein
MMPSVVEVSVLSAVELYLWPISERVVHVTVPYLTLTKMATNSISATEDTTCLSTVVWKISGPLVTVGADEFDLFPR